MYGLLGDLTFAQEIRYLLIFTLILIEVITKRRNFPVTALGYVNV
ncbi:hypothetical protein [Halalkalibacter oceani]